MVVTESAKVDDTAKLLTSTAEKLKVERVGISYLTPDNGGVRGYKINLVPEVKNTIFVYRRKMVTDKFVNLKADEKGLAQLAEAINKVTAAQ
jgi:hypothetical protein